MSPNRKVLDTLGRKRKPGYVRVFRETHEGRELVRVQWREPDAPVPSTESFDDSRKGIAEAKAFAAGVHDRLTSKAPSREAIPPITVRALREAYVTAKSTEWAPNTLRLSNERWGKFELFIGRQTDAGGVRRERLDELKKALLERQAPNQVKHILTEVVRVYKWGVDRDLIAPTKITMYTVRIRRHAVAAGPKMAEYSADERLRLTDQFNPRNVKQWRPWVLNTVLAFCGPRVNAALQIEITDVELAEPVFTHSPQGCIAEFAGSVHWRAETDKMGTERIQPLPAPAAEALWVALGWRQFDQYAGRFIFYGAQRRTRATALRRDTRRARNKTEMGGIVATEKPWTYSAFHAFLLRAETGAGIGHIKYRGAHAHRRGVAGDVHDQRGSVKDAADFIGDRSTRVVQDRYLLQRAKALEGIAQRLGANRNEPQRESTSSDSSEQNVVDSQQLTGEPAVGIEPTTARLQDT